MVEPRREDVWTKRPPDREAIGFYWWRQDVSFSGSVVFVRDGSILIPGDREFANPLLIGGEWFGPIMAPGGDVIENCDPISPIGEIADSISIR